MAFLPGDLRAAKTAVERADGHSTRFCGIDPGKKVGFSSSDMVVPAAGLVLQYRESLNQATALLRSTFSLLAEKLQTSYACHSIADSPVFVRFLSRRRTRLVDRYEMLIGELDAY